MALMILFMTQWWTTTRVHITGDESMRDQVRQLKDGRVEYAFTERLVLISNHQVLASFAFYVLFSNSLNTPTIDA